MSLNEKKGRLIDVIDDVAAYSVAGLCATLLSELFLDYKEFKISFVNKLVSHLGLPETVNSTMVAFIENPESVLIDSFIDSILKQPALEQCGNLVVQDLILFCITDGNGIEHLRKGAYDARLRVLIHNVALNLRVKLTDVQTFEQVALLQLVEADHVLSEEELQFRSRANRMRRIKRGFLIAAATIGGGTLLGLTGGLAAPFVAAGAGVVIGGTGAAVLGSAAGVAIVGSLFGAAGAGLAGYKMKKRVGEVEEFAFEVLTSGDDLHISIVISGWLSTDNLDAFREPWFALRQSKEQYCLRYESRYLLELGRTLQSLVSVAVSMAVTEALKTTVLAGFISAIAWPASILSLASLIDQPWLVCLRRSAEVGRVLADTLISRQQGKRPVTLLGFSLGARVIFYCLEEMSKRNGSAGIVEDVILLGAPVTNSTQSWEPFARVVSGNIINGYCRGDWLLSFLHRTSSITFNIAGLKPVEWTDRRMVNVDLTEIVSGHFDYGNKIGEILLALGIRTKEIDVSSTSSSLCMSKSRLLECGSGAQDVDIVTSVTATESQLSSRKLSPERHGNDKESVSDQFKDRN